MNIFQRTKLAFKAAVSGWQGKLFDFTSWFGRTFWGIDNSQLATNENIFSVITRLSNTMASLPLKLYKDYDIHSNNVAFLIANEPNAQMTSFEFMRTMEVNRNETGNAYAIIQRDIRAQVEAIYPLDPTYVTPFTDLDTGELWYKIIAQNGTYYANSADVIHVKHITGASRLAGISPLKVLANTLRFDKAVQDFALSEMEKLDSFLLSYGANVDEEKKKQVVDNFRQFYAENGGVLFKEPGIEIAQLEKQYISSDIINNEKITRDRVANVYNVPVIFLNETGGGFSNTEQLMIQFVQMTVTPIVRQYEQEFNKKLLTTSEKRSGFYFKFNMGALLRGDTAARTAFYHSASRDGYMTRDEIRRYEDLPPMGGQAAELWISGDMYPLEMDPALRKTTSLRGGEGNGKSE